MKKIILLVLILATSASAGMIEYTDNDPVQTIIFYPDSGLCDTNTVDSIDVMVQIHPDSAFSSFHAILCDTLYSLDFKYISPDIDSLGRSIPGHYVGDYTYYTITWFNNQPKLSADSVHQSVDYWRFGGCLPFHGVD